MQNDYVRLNEELSMAYELMNHIESNMSSDRKLNLSINEIHLIEKISSQGGRTIVNLAEDLKITKASVTEIGRAHV